MRTRGLVAFAGIAVLLVVPGPLRAAPPESRSNGTTATRAGVMAATRADLETARRRADRLEAEQALGGTRRPYLVLDLEKRSLSYHLMGMTLREIPLGSVRFRGLQPSPVGSGHEAGRVAGIFSLREKSDDPRLNPLTPEQIEAGLDDEDAADALPPEPPATFTLSFQQPVRVMIDAGAGLHDARGVLASAAGRIARLLGRGPARDSGGDRLALEMQVEATTAAEIYRSLIPGLRFLVLPPAGLLLPEAGQEAPGAIRPARPAPRPTPRPPSSPPASPGVPFQIPPPVSTDPGASFSALPPAALSAPGGGAPAVPGGDSTPVPGPGATPVPGSEAAPIPAIRIPRHEPASPAGSEGDAPAEPQPTPEP